MKRQTMPNGGAFIHRLPFNSHTRRPSLTVVWTGQLRTNEYRSAGLAPLFSMKIVVSKPQVAR